MVKKDCATRTVARIVSAALLAILAACSHKPAPAAKPPPEVGVITLRPQRVTISTDLPGRTVPYRIAEVRPQVSGLIIKRLFVEGRNVVAGEQLYQIDPAPFKANLESAEASLARAQATLTSARLLAERYKPLAEAHAVSQQAFDNAVASQQQAAADVASARASGDTAKINLTYTRVLSPIAGRSGRSSVTEGALVAANQTSALVVVQQLDPIYVDVNQPSTVLLRLKRALAAGGLKKVGDGQTQAKLTLEDGTDYGQVGTLQFSEVAVDSGTGSITLRAVFPNPDGILLPGMFVHERLDEGVDEQGLLVPQEAVTHNQRGDATAMVVSGDNKVHTQVIKTERAIGDQWLVSEGLAAGDRVIVVGLQRIAGGTSEVNPKEVPATGDPTGQGGPAGQGSPAPQNTDASAAQP